MAGLVDQEQVQGVVVIRDESDLHELAPVIALAVGPCQGQS
jgi:hypothetical protein